MQVTEAGRAGSFSPAGINRGRVGPGKTSGDNSFGLLAQLEDGPTIAEVDMDTGVEPGRVIQTGPGAPLVPHASSLVPGEAQLGLLAPVQATPASVGDEVAQPSNLSLHLQRVVKEGAGQGMKMGRKPLVRAHLFAKAAMLELEKRQNIANFKSWRGGVTSRPNGRGGGPQKRWQRLWPSFRGASSAMPSMLRALSLWSRNKLTGLERSKEQLEMEVAELYMREGETLSWSSEQTTALVGKVKELSTTLGRLNTWWKQRAKVCWI
ncbi:hypothetical protein KSP40_PGU004359 [Platanthera guangdongensis]|uniref:Uncharacterized protein n=1 Tax=Platanthera guangdongensis TaxID=2320717 RepID=A0ABR2M220_9ASPA